MELWPADHSFWNARPGVCVCVCVCVRAGGGGLETSRIRRPRCELGRHAIKNKAIFSIIKRKWCNFYSVNQGLRFSTCFKHYLLILRRRYTNETWYIACVLCQLAAPILVHPTDITCIILTAASNARNMYRSLIVSNLNKNCITLVSLYWYIMMRGQQNIIVFSKSVLNVMKPVMLSGDILI
jgi:hypothetical protein